MYLNNLKLWNFRKYGSQNEINLDEPNLDLDFQNGLNLITGENDSGKTAIIDSIKIVLKTSSMEWIQLSKDDFYKNTKEIRIELLFSDISIKEGKNFTEFLTLHKQDGVTKRSLRLIFTAYIKDNRLISNDVKAGSDTIGKTIPADMREFLKVTYLKPLRDVKSELIPKKNSRLSQIFLGHEAFRKEEGHILMGIYKEFNDSIRMYFDGKDKQGTEIEEALLGKQLKKTIDKNIASFFDSTITSNISTTNEEIRKILEGLELSLSNIDNPGLGSLNRLFMASELIHLNKSNWSGLKLGLIEEIEAHLHPQVQLKVIKSLLDEDGVQLLMTTHSPNIASKVPLSNLIICRNNRAYPMASKYTKLDESDYEFLEKFLDVTKSSLFFAKGLILVEGWSEELVIPIIAEKLGFNLVEREVTVVNVGNLGFSNYYNIFKRANNESMGIKIALITDCDAQAYTEVIEDKIKKYKKINENEYKQSCKKEIKRKSELYGEPATPFISNEWTFEWALLRSKILGKIFEEAVMEVHSQIDSNNFEEELAKKLLIKTLSKSKIAYKFSQKLSSQSISWKDLKNDLSVSYIVEAIKHVCS